MSFLIVVTDPLTGQIRSFHSAVFNDSDQAAIGRMVDKHFKVVRTLEKSNQFEKSNQTVPNGEPKHHEMMTQAEIARSKGLTGNACQQCGGFNLTRTGSCETCGDCGWNKGCG
jgi:hypothetical protein